MPTDIDFHPSIITILMLKTRKLHLLIIPEKSVSLEELALHIATTKPVNNKPIFNIDRIALFQPINN